MTEVKTQAAIPRVGWVADGRWPRHLGRLDTGQWPGREAGGMEGGIQGYMEGWRDAGRDRGRDGGACTALAQLCSPPAISSRT